MPTLNASSAQNGDDLSTLPDISFSSTSPFRPCTQTADLSMPSTYQESGYYKEATVTSDAGELWINIEEVGLVIKSLQCSHKVVLNGV